MSVLLAIFLFLLSMATHSSGALYCLCKDGLSDSVLQKNIDYACGAGADCSAISQGGACYNPNTVKDHCNFAVNSYFQKKGQATGSCEFSGTATTSSNPPTLTNGCSYPSSGGGGTPTTPGTGTGTPGAGTPGTGTPGTGTPSTGTPGTGTPGAGTPGTGTPGTGTPGTGTPGTGTGTGTPGTGTGTGTPGTGTGTGTGTPGTGTGTGTGTPGTSTGNPGTGTGTGTPSTTFPGSSPFPNLGPTGGISNPDGSGTASLHQSTNLLNSLTLTFLFLCFLC